MKAIRLYLSKKLIQLGNYIAKGLIEEMKLKQSTIEFLKSLDGKNKRNN